MTKARHPLPGSHRRRTSARAEAVAAGYIKVGDVALVASSPTSPDFEAVATAAAAADLAIMCISVPSSEVSGPQARREL